MNKFLKYGSVFLLIVILALVFTKPTEQDFFNKIVSDYSHVHPGFELSNAELENMGSTQYHSQLLFSSYTYKFGGIEVSYWGILGNVFYRGYENEGENEGREEEKSTTIDV
ncbi:MAG: hypothetical protein ACI91R_000242 [Vicingaceae bacterium]|jgi:hypothetical protein